MSAGAGYTKERYWCGTVPLTDDFGDAIVNEFIDGRTIYGPCAFMTPRSWKAKGVGDGKRFGPGIGQRYLKQDDGRWLKVEG